MKTRALLVLQVMALLPHVVQADDSQWIVTTRNTLEPALAAEYDREMTGVLAYAGNQSVVQVVTLAFPLGPEEMASWPQRFATALETTGASAVATSDEQVEAENIPAAPVPIMRVTCDTGEHEGQVGVICSAMFLNL